MVGLDLSYYKASDKFESDSHLYLICTDMLSVQMGNEHFIVYFCVVDQKGCAATCPVMDYRHFCLILDIVGTPKSSFPSQPSG